MNKKGMFELADLGGFILIFVVTIIFGFIFIKTSPQAHIEVLDAEYGNYLARYVLLDFLNYKENEKTISDYIALAVKDNNNFDYVDKKVYELLSTGDIFALVIYKDNEIVYYNSNVPELPSEEVIAEHKSKYDIYGINLRNFYDDNIYVQLYLLKKQRLYNE